MSFVLVEEGNAKYVFDSSDNTVEIVKDDSILSKIKYRTAKMEYQKKGYLFPKTLYTYLLKSYTLEVYNKDPFKFWGSIFNLFDDFYKVLPANSNFYEYDTRIKYFAEFRELGGKTNAFLIVFYGDYIRRYYIAEHYDDIYQVTRINFTDLGFKYRDEHISQYSCRVGLGKKYSNCIYFAYFKHNKSNQSYFYKGAFHDKAL